jgi:hypothetical protein
MSRANEAYKKGDMQALQQILKEWEHRDKTTFPNREGQSQADRLAQKIQQVRNRINEIEKRISELKRSELYLLMVKVQQAELFGRDLLGEMAKSLQDQIIAARKLLLSYKGRE